MNAMPVKLGFPRGHFVRLDRECRGEWKTVAVYNLCDVLAIPLDVARGEMLSCGCGSYELGACELCNAEVAL